MILNKHNHNACTLYDTLTSHHHVAAVIQLQGIVTT